MHHILIITIALLSANLIADTETMTEEKLKRSLSQHLSGTLEIGKTPLKGIYEVVHDGNNVFYTDENAEYLLQGPLFDIKRRKDLTEQRLKSWRLQALDAVPTERFIEFGDPEAEHTVVVLTDVNCGYCRKLHRQQAKYAKYGIRIRYLLTPVLGDDSIVKARSVWCADNRRKTLTAAKAGKNIPTIHCDARLDDNLQLMESLGVRGTPAILLEDGTLIGGYVDPEQLLSQIEVSEEG